MGRISNWIILMVELSRETLRGLQGVEVVIESLRPEIKVDGLTEDLLRTDIEQKLRMVGLKVLSRRERLITPGQPFLHVYANIIKSYDQPGYIYNIFIGLGQAVSLVRAPDIRATSHTWLVGETGATDELEDIRATTKDLVDRFISVYLSENPK